MRKTSQLFSLFAAVALAMVSQSVWADAAATPAPTPAPPVIAVGGMVDSYYTFNFTNSSVNKGAGNGAGNLGTYFNTQDEAFAMGMAELKATATQGNASAHLVLNYGQEGNLLLAGSPADGIDVLQAYIAYVADQWTFSAGRFVTWMGNEVIESNGNWNYSRSQLFWATIPLWHTGVSVAWAPDAKFGATFYAVDGWNNTGVVSSATATDLGHTYGAQFAWHPDASTSIILNGIIGPGGSAVAGGNDPGDARYVAELIASLAATDKFSIALDAEYFGQDQDIPVNGATAPKALTGWGVDLYGRYQVASDWALALRLEELYDDNGYAGLAAFNSSATTPAELSGEVRDVTLTVEHNLTTNLLMRVEGRMDMAVLGGTQLSATSATATFPYNGPYAGASGTQATGTASMVFSF